MKYIGIDIGTTTISAVAADENKNVLKTYTVENDSFISSEFDFEKIQDTNRILEKAGKLLDEILNEFPDTAAIGLTGQMHGIVYTDRNGYAVSPLITWQDDRGNQPLQDGKSLCQLLQETLGVTVFNGYGLVSHLYNVKTDSVPKDAVSICTIGDYIGMRLTGRTSPLMHISNAASLGFFDVKEKRFQIRQLEDAGTDLSILPEITETFVSIGKYKGIPVSAAIGDNQASFLGSVDDPEDTVLINMGTGGQISVCTHQYLEIPGIETRPLTDQLYLLVGASLCGGRAYAVLEQFFRSFAKKIDPGIHDCYDLMTDLMADFPEKSDDENDLIVTPLFSGTRTNPSLRGNITNISTANFTPGHLISGMLTGMSEELYEMYRKIQEKEGKERHSMIASGNGIRKNPQLQKILSKRFGLEIRLAGVTEEAACGAAFVTYVNEKNRG